jgi:V/A-type H+/Na+-transporting ATPase subunit D
MRRADLSATKSTLLRLREHFGFVKSGHELLDQKRQIILEELIDMYRETGQLRRELETALSAMYDSLRQALLAGGRAPLAAEALAQAGTQRLRVRERSVMGVTVPLLDLETKELEGQSTAPGWTTPAVARVRRQVREALPVLARVAEIEVSCRRLAAELQKTQRKVNALENIFIPEYRDTIQFIEASLEEKEREALFQLKRLKGRRAPTGGV